MPTKFFKTRISLTTFSRLFLTPQRSVGKNTLWESRDRLGIYLSFTSNFKSILANFNFYLPLKYPEKHRFSDNFRENKLVNLLEFTWYIFFLSGFSFATHSRITKQKGRGRPILTSPWHFHLIYKYLDIRRAITAENSPLHVASDLTRTWNLKFLSASR